MVHENRADIFISMPTCCFLLSVICIDEVFYGLSGQHAIFVDKAGWASPLLTGRIVVCAACCSLHSVHLDSFLWPSRGRKPLCTNICFHLTSVHYMTPVILVCLPPPRALFRPQGAAAVRLLSTTAPEYWQLCCLAPSAWGQRVSEEGWRLIHHARTSFCASRMPLPGSAYSTFNQALCRHLPNCKEGKNERPRTQGRTRGGAALVEIAVSMDSQHPHMPHWSILLVMQNSSRLPGL